MTPVLLIPYLILVKELGFIIGHEDDLFSAYSALKFCNKKGEAVGENETDPP